ncbi:hypothetical protein ES703_55071 [subsurface metagenome]
MPPSGTTVTQLVNSKTIPESGLETPELQYIAAETYCEFNITLSQDVIYEEATDEDFFIAAISSKAYESWLEEEDIIDHKKRRPL